eukprot:TRINITY_DN34964_c0_g1_i1.p1 TRINITY_DN34964_c0_g1~~TRINITY_DN34964_c0_g1_i1.p1  ORF type:complete len:1338 (+),score=322.62 TRINITY_DN34964_c0_g1_i1:231-4244(+)
MKVGHAQTTSRLEDADSIFGDLGSALPPKLSRSVTLGDAMRAELAQMPRGGFDDCSGQQRGRLQKSNTMGAKQARSSSRKATANLEDAEMKRSTTKKLTTTTSRTARLADPSSKLQFLTSHAFFEGTSQSLREALAPQMVRRSHDPQATNTLLVEQGATPTGNMDYLFLTGRDACVRLEVLFDGKVVGDASDAGVMGQEAIFQVTTRFVCSIRLAAGTLSGLWVIPRQVLQLLLAKEAHKRDFAILQARAEKCLVDFLLAWYYQPAAHVNVRLFRNSTHEFVSNLLQSVNVHLYGEGTTIMAMGSASHAGLCVYRGEAEVKIEDKVLITLRHIVRVNAWAAWWGMVGMLGVCLESPVEVVATTDCIVFSLSAESYYSLRQNYTSECRLLEKVGVEHIKLLQPSAVSLLHQPLFERCNPDFLTALQGKFEKKIYPQGHFLVVKGEEHEMTRLIFVARGFVQMLKEGESRTVRARAAVVVCVDNDDDKSPERGSSPDNARSRQSSRQPASESSPKHRHPLFKKLQPNAKLLGSGSYFGEQAALGFVDFEHTVACKTMCDLRELSGDSIIQLLNVYPKEGKVFELLALENGLDPELVDGSLTEVSMLQPLGDELVGEMERSMERLVAFEGQVVFKQDSVSKSMYILVKGDLVIEIDGQEIAHVCAPAVLHDAAVIRHSMGEGHAAWFTARCTTYCVFRVGAGADIAAFIDEKHHGSAAECPYRTQLVELGQWSLRRLWPILKSDDPVGEGLVASQARRVSMQRSRTEKFASKTERDENFKAAFEQLSASQTFAKSHAEFRKFLARHCEKAVYLDNQILMQQGEDGDFAILVQHGACVVEVGNPPTRVGEVKDGGFIGEAVILGMSQTRTATVRATGLVQTLILSRSAVLSAFDMYPDEQDKIMKIAVAREGVTNALSSMGAPTPAKPQLDIRSQRETVVAPSTQEAAPASSKRATLTGHAEPDASPSRRVSQVPAGRNPGGHVPSWRRGSAISIAASLVEGVMSTSAPSGGGGNLRNSAANRASAMAAISGQQRRTLAAAPTAGLQESPGRKSIDATPSTASASAAGVPRPRRGSASFIALTADVGQQRKKAAVDMAMGRMHSGGRRQSSMGSSVSRQPSGEEQQSRKAASPFAVSEAGSSDSHHHGVEPPELPLAAVADATRHGDSFYQTPGSTMNYISEVSSCLENSMYSGGSERDDRATAEASPGGEYLPEGLRSSPCSSQKIAASDSSIDRQMDSEVAAIAGCLALPPILDKKIDMSLPLSPHMEWAKKREAAIHAAPQHRERQMVKADRLAPLVPHANGYLEAGMAPKSWGDAMQQRVKKVAGVYGARVWKHYYG